MLNYPSIDNVNITGHIILLRIEYWCFCYCLLHYYLYVYTYDSEVVTLKCSPSAL